MRRQLMQETITSMHVNLHGYQVTPQTRVVFEELTVAQLFKKSLSLVEGL
jgi:hypothetical protein